MLVQLNARQVDRKQSQTKGSIGTVLASAAAGPQAWVPHPVFRLERESRRHGGTINAGARNYLTKPFDISPFLAMVDEILEEAAPIATL
jgi:CheY-like chemotaxis protein